MGLNSSSINSRAINSNNAKKTFKTDEICDVSGDYKRVEDGDIAPAVKGDKFPPYHEKTGEMENGAPLFNPEPKVGNYKLVTKEEK